MELDDREIAWISGAAPREMFYEIGKQGVEKITGECETRPMCTVLWFAVWRSGKVVRRCNAAFVEEVAYKED